MTSRFIKIFIFYLLAIITIASGYGFNSWWKFIPSTIGIFIITKIFFPKDWLRILGLKVNLQMIFIAFTVFLVFCFVSFFIIKAALAGSKYEVISGALLDYLTMVFQTLNEELVFRGLLLSGLTFLGLKKWKTILLPAFIFTLFHWLFYKFNMHPQNRGDLAFTTMASLFLFGFSMSAIFLKTRNILIPWALHYAWNFNRFGSHIVLVENHNQQVSELISFNILEGSLPMLILASFVAILVVFMTKEPY